MQRVTRVGYCSSSSMDWNSVVPIGDSIDVNHFPVKYLLCLMMVGVNVLCLKNVLKRDLLDVMSVQNSCQSNCWVYVA